MLVNQQQTDTSTLEITEKIPLEKFIFAQNLKRYHQIEVACPLLNNP